ncbi:hypothetical protein J2I47_08440 [Fibrella sp. HMF5335]|uniref:Lipoprotein n=1 Tax=Fibrella rubiginis TaxID=2817060 RepID=A0A939GEZ5_9BACT|nr:hypothetical protein [Fibrella rubiginis]MBO0936568.1 hypothetical protein [Fibrella rubiginis]
MKITYTLLALSVVFLACQGRKSAPSEVAMTDTARLLAVASDDDIAEEMEQSNDLSADFLIVPGQQVGPIRADASEASLIRLLGKANVVHDTIYTVEGQFDIGTTLYRNTADQAHVLWRDKKRFARPETVLIRPARDENNDLLPGAAGKTVQWATADGLRVGSTLRDVEAINGKPFNLYGFEWDYGGQSSGWRGGSLETKTGKTFIGATFGFDHDVPDNQQAFFEAVMGDIEFLSNNTALQQLNPTVQTLSISFQ